KGFNAIYGTNVFKYRVVGRSLHLWLYHKLENSQKVKQMKENTSYDKRLTALDAEADNTFYLTYFITATVFSIFTALALLYLFDTAQIFDMPDSRKIFITSALLLLIGFTQFVITPYDNLGYFLLVSTVLLFIKYLQTRHIVWMIQLNACIILSTLNRESALVSLSMMAAIYFSHFGFNFRWVRFMIVPVACYLLTWVGLRLYFHDGGPGTVTEGLKFWRNLDLRQASNMMGFLFAVVTFYFVLNITDKSVNRKLVLNFLLMSSPYILMIPVIGIMIELRLWMPIILGAVLLSQVNFAAITFPGTSRVRGKAGMYPAMS
ncbi:MAG: hypothetical protein JST39_02075, partial [Bacteroidetes bacterium]|nr:hypothetical protein [Bacteroidota bacterium]